MLLRADQVITLWVWLRGEVRWPICQNVQVMAAPSACPGLCAGSRDASTIPQWGFCLATRRASTLATWTLRATPYPASFPM